ncbi:hypothetical protein BaRGS_00026496 [Batillaria attramentaria]|uniref:C1q domain-containing protein n=1 Tax=Batillaria attramentaria TaxID=370345 RepID=A0ABD0K582_9CAEN
MLLLRLLLFLLGGGDDNVLATEVMGSLFLPPGATINVEFIPNAGVRLLNVATKDSGTYSVHVNINLHGSIVTEVQTVETPSNQTVPSTSSSDGTFFLSLPSPVATGEYTCFLDNSSPASLCVESDSSLRKGASVVVDKMDARFAILASQMAAQEQEKTDLQNQLTDMKLREELMEQENAALQLQLDNLAAKIDAATQSVSFLASISSQTAQASEFNSGERIAFTITHLNNGNAYDRDTGVFTAPVNGTYVFLANLQLHSSSPSRRNVYTILKLGGSDVLTCYIAYDDYYDMGSCDVVLYMTAGQQVWLEIFSGGGGITLDSPSSSAFSGALIHTDI